MKLARFQIEKSALEPSPARCGGLLDHHTKISGGSGRAPRLLKIQAAQTKRAVPGSQGAAPILHKAAGAARPSDSSTQQRDPHRPEPEPAAVPAAASPAATPAAAAHAGRGGPPQTSSLPRRRGPSRRSSGGRRPPPWRSRLMTLGHRLETLPTRHTSCHLLNSLLRCKSGWQPRRSNTRRRNSRCRAGARQGNLATRNVAFYSRTFPVVKVQALSARAAHAAR